MKKLTIVICLATILVSCKKNDVIFRDDPIGIWEMTRRIGDFSPITYSPGEGNILQLNANKTYTLTESFKQVGAGKYEILKKGTTKANQTFDSISFSDRSSLNTISIQGGILSIGTAPNDANGNIIMDGEVKQYTRQK